jgi:hypothetical protein
MKSFKWYRVLIINIIVFIVLSGCSDEMGTSKLILPKEYNKSGNMIILTWEDNHIYIKEMNRSGSLVWKYMLENEYEFTDGLYNFSFARLKDGSNLIKTPDGNRVIQIDKDGKIISELNIQNLSFPDKYIIKNIATYKNEIYLTLRPRSEFSRWRIIGLDREYRILWQYMVFEDWAYMVEKNGNSQQYTIKSIEGINDLIRIPIQSISFDKKGEPLIFVDAQWDIDATGEVENDYVGPRLLMLNIDWYGKPVSFLGYDEPGATPGHNSVMPNLHRINPITEDELLLVGVDRVSVFKKNSGEVSEIRYFPDYYPVGFLGDDKFIQNAYLTEVAGYISLIIGTNCDITRYQNDEIIWKYEVENGKILDFLII